MQHQDVASYYAQEAAALRRAVSAAVTASPALVDDACAFAWCQLVRRHDSIDLGRGAYWWLYRVATREAWRLKRADCKLHPVGAATDVAALLRDEGDTTFARLEYDETLRALATVPERQRRLLVLSAAGFTYAEISRITGDTVRTVERQLDRGRRALRAAHGD